MRKRKLLNLSAIILGALMCFSFNKVQAADSVFSDVDLTRDNLQSVAKANRLTTSMSTKYLGISKNRESGNYYQWNVNTTGEGKTVWKIATYPSLTSNTANYNDLYYCLNASRGFGISNGEMAQGAKDTYNSNYDMKDSTNKSNITNYAAGNLGTNYNKVLWVLDNSYIPGTSTSADKSNLLKQAYAYRDETRNFSEYLSDTLIDNNSKIDLTDEQIEVVQQLAIWHFTNGYDVNPKILYKNGAQITATGDNYDVGGYGVYFVNEGEIVAWKMEALYNYFIEAASSTYSSAIPTLSLSNTKAKVEEDGNYFIAGPFELTGESTKAIKSITPNVSKATLLNSSKEVVNGNDFKQVIGSNFYLRFAKSDITESTQINLNLEYEYDIRTLTFMTDENDPTNTQPVVLVKNEEQTKDVNTNIDINLTQVSVEKVWNDRENQDGVRPTSIKVALYEGSIQKDVQTLSEENNWTYTWIGLLAGKSYSVVELDEKNNKIETNGKYNDDYLKVEYTLEGTKTIITNIHIPEITKVEGTKTWEDNKNQDGIRPESITVNLFANGEKVDSKEVTGPEWTYSFTDLDKYKDGKEIAYTIDEETVDGYTKTIDGYDITNTYTPDLGSIKITKTTTGATTPENTEFTITGPNDYSKTVKYSEFRNGSYTIDNLPVGKYTVVEDENSAVVANYTLVVTGDKNTEKEVSKDATTEYTITNTYTPVVVEPNPIVDLALRKYITSINKTVIDASDSDYRVPNIDKANLNNKQEHTAATAEYKHKKAPIEVKTGDFVTYNITIYNEGEVAGRATKITDQLPQGLHFEEILTDGYTADYDESNNKLVITKTGTNNLNSFVKNGELSSETIQIKCKVTLEADDNEDKILTNIAYISEIATENGDIIDRDSEVDNTNIRNLESYKDNEALSSTKDSYIPGQEDDDDFDKLIIKAINPTGKYNVVLRKVDNSGNELTGAKIKVNGKEYSVGKATIAKDVNITSTNPIILEYTLEEITAPEGYLGLSSAKDIKIKLEITKLDKTYKITRAYLVDGEGQKIASSHQINVSLDENTSTIIINVINNPIKKEFDLSLRKFITKVNDKKFERAPIVYTKTIATTGTATYKHTKEPVAVQVGDIVTYTIRVYNEGETDGYASQITDHLPEWLDFLPDDELNQKYLWQQDMDNNRTITTNITSKDSATGEELYKARENKQLLSAYDGGETLDYIDVEIKCKVNEKAQVKQLITNIAEISEMQDEEGTEVITDRDSTKANVNLPTDKNLPNYKGKESNKSDLTDKNYYYKGQEDDDDFEKLVVENFDLALRKFIIGVNDTELKSDVIEGNTYSREPVVDTSKLGTIDGNGNSITTAIYNHPKTPVEVKKGDIVTYIIRIYNEGTLAGYANEIVENIPEGLEFIEDSSINKTYGWQLTDGKLTTNYLSDQNVENVINAVKENTDGTKILSYKDVQVQFKVVADPVKFAGEIITNWAEISADSNNDIDSIPGNDVKTEDDIDYEPVKLVYFDLALRKFITNVDGTEYNNRIPEVDTSKLGTVDEITGEKITTAKYTHTKDPVVLETGSTVVYTIRVYNEGTVDGYATEITDNIPEGLEFLPENEVNSQYKWTMIDEEGNITTDVTKAKKITTNYLSEENDSSNIISGYQESNGTVALDYKDVKVAFKVTQSNTSDRIIVNTAQISEDSDDDIDSTPGNDILTEDDIDREYVKVETFDLALEKWVTATKVTYNGKTKTTKTGFTADSKEMAKVDLVGKQLKKTTVKFVYSIRVINEGQVAGYATEIKDYIPSGLKFVKEDNPDWTLQKNGTVTTDKLKDTLLEPGQSATVKITLTWKNSSTNMGVKTNWAEISKDSGDDIDSTPDNYNKIEDDIDDASVILSIKTGSTKMYIALALISVTILGGGVFLIKRYVLTK